MDQWRLRMIFFSRSPAACSLATGGGRWPAAAGKSVYFRTSAGRETGDAPRVNGTPRVGPLSAAVWAGEIIVAHKGAADGTVAPSSNAATERSTVSILENNAAAKGPAASMPGDNTAAEVPTVPIFGGNTAAMFLPGSVSGIAGFVAPGQRNIIRGRRNVTRPCRFQRPRPAECHTPSLASSPPVGGVSCVAGGAG